MLLPDEDAYDERHYLRDAFHAWARYWSNDLHKYFGGSLKKHKGVSAWEEWAALLAIPFWICIGLGALVLIGWVTSR